MSGKKGRSGRKPGPQIVKGKPERDQMIVAYWREGHSLRVTAKVFRMSPAGIAKVVRGLSRDSARMAETAASAVECPSLIETP